MEQAELLVRYYKMDPDHPPPGIVKLEICGHCDRPAVLIHEPGGWWNYIHTAWLTGEIRHFCKIHQSGRKMEVNLLPEGE